MNIRTAPRRGTRIVATTLAAAALCLAPAAGAFAVAPVAPVSAVTATTQSPSDVLASTPWETTGAVDQDGNAVALSDEAVANFVGWAYYKTDGTFTMYNLDDSPKMQGDWSVSADGSERTLVAKDADGKVLFERVVPIVTLTAAEFTYRVIPDAANPGAYYDIVHTPTDHPEPGATAPGDGDAAATDDGAPAPGTEAADPEGGAVEDGDQLAVTGEAAPVVAVAAGAVALLGGGAVLLTRFVRRGRATS